MSSSPARHAERSRSEKYGHVERERRWLLHRRPPGLTPEAAHARTTDLYLPGTSLRLRHVLSGETGQSLWKLTQKQRLTPGDPEEILVTTLYLSAEEYALFSEMFWRRGARELRKDRYPHDHAGRRYAVDMFHGALAGLILAETECASPEEWEGLAAPDFAARDVSRDEAFTGGALAALTTGEARALLEALAQGREME